MPLFVAIDVFGVLPVFVGLTTRLDEPRRRRLATEATLTALAVSAGFLVAGQALFRLLGITEADFRVGGGIVLLVLAVSELLLPVEQTREVNGSLGIVPIGVPLIMGPAALTTVLLVVDSVGYGWTFVALCANLVIVWAVLVRATAVLHVLGSGGARALAKIVALFLAGIAVMLIRSGVAGMLAYGAR